MQLKIHDDFEVVDLGIQELEVYDIEVEDTHNFFGNDILVHNSAYFEFSDLVNILCPDSTDVFEITDRLDVILKEIIQPEIIKQTEELCCYLNNYDNKMIWEREVISPVSINVAKKRYAMMITDSEGVRYSTPKMKIIGLDSKRSSTPKWAKSALEHCYKLALEDKKVEMHEFIDELYNNFTNMNPSEIAIPRSVSNIEKYESQGHAIKGTPKHVKAAIYHNSLIDKLKLNHIEKIKSGNKLKFIELKPRNPLGYDVIGFTTYLPKEFELDKYVDYDTIFEKGFKSPLQNFLNSIKWTTEEIITLF